MPLQIVRNDITKMTVDAIVNAANNSLLGGGGVDGAIHRAAGPRLLEECRKLGGCETGQAKATKGYNLPAKFVIHTVGPVWHGGDHGEPGLLASCYRNSLRIARKLGCESVAFPMISTGVYGYPKELALPVATQTITEFLMENEMQVYLVVFGAEALAVSMKLFSDVRQYIDQHYVDEHTDRRRENIRQNLWREDAEKALKYDQMLGESLFPRNTGVSSFANAAPSSKPKRPRERLIEKPRPKAETPDWEKMLRQTDEGFSRMLLRKIDEKGMTDAQCYKKANVDRKLFNKIKNNPGYRPGKPTVFAFAVALELNLAETKEMLEKAGFALSHSSKMDIVLEYFIKNSMYDLLEINEVLFQFDLPLLGSAA
ncbi:MAG: O-acetyl-ADP-ribose deacetylase [Clostridia bacterium]|nr:O-acetyl-ADP-ribose deacetylase [Clostridia bacterium]